MADETKFPVTDGRKKLEWKTRYNKNITKRLWREGIYDFILFVVAIVLIFVSINKLTCTDYNGNKVITSIILSMSSGLLGGVSFGMKFFYHTIAKGYWNQDRLAWRLLSPFIAVSMAFIVTLVVDEGIIDAFDLETTWKNYIIIGFLSGYFADDAARKMKDIATVIFGNSNDNK